MTMKVLDAAPSFFFFLSSVTSSPLLAFVEKSFSDTFKIENLAATEAPEKPEKKHQSINYVDQLHQDQCQDKLLFRHAQ